MLQVRPPLVSMGWYPERGFIEHDWTGYDEAMLVYILALGSPTHPVEPEAWEAWTRTYDDSWGIFQGQEYLSFAPHFGHQYSHAWIDFRGIRDAYMRGRGIDYLENSRRATYAQRSYAIENPMKWKDYGENVWGLTASDGPQQTLQEYRGEQRPFRFLALSAHAQAPQRGKDHLGRFGQPAAQAQKPDLGQQPRLARG